jgi:outer membrane protein assembly factor BamD (BamD/ComL family)
MAYMNKFVKNAGLLSALITLFLCSCASTVKISDDLSPAELIQRAQEASDKNRYKIALQYYQALYDRNRSNLDLVITAEYEIAFIHYKQRKFQQAREEMNAILEYYNTPDEELLPQHFKRLAQIVLKSIEEKEAQSTLFQRNPAAATDTSS